MIGLQRSKTKPHPRDAMLYDIRRHTMAASCPNEDSRQRRGVFVHHDRRGLPGAEVTLHPFDHMRLPRSMLATDSLQPGGCRSCQINAPAQERFGFRPSETIVCGAVRIARELPYAARLPAEPCAIGETIVEPGYVLLAVSELLTYRVEDPRVAAEQNA